MVICPVCGKDKNKPSGNCKGHPSLGEVIQTAQVEAGENVVLEGLRAKGLIPQIHDQPPPIHNDQEPVYKYVLEDIEERVRIGRERYGVALQPYNGRDALVDGYQEIVDLVFYIRQEIRERQIVSERIQHFLSVTGFPFVPKDGDFSTLSSTILTIIGAGLAMHQEREMLRRERKGEVWFWDADRVENYLESLACPIIIHPEDMRAIIREQQQDDGDIRKIIEVCKEFGWLGEGTKNEFAQTWLRKRLSDPIPMILFCPNCYEQHIDGEEPPCGKTLGGEWLCDRAMGHDGGCYANPPEDLERWKNPPHKSHKCHNCNLIWRPANVATIGVPADRITPG